jgi:hypothetical protein
VQARRALVTSPRALQNFCGFLTQNHQLEARSESYKTVKILQTWLWTRHSGLSRSALLPAFILRHPRFHHLLQQNGRQGLVQREVNRTLDTCYFSSSFLNGTIAEEPIGKKLQWLVNAA